jgi:demethylmenaquinone methyltransferase/2-methoxy-6-polyprenyl-1,4-benzoquinol methylase
VNSYYGVGDQRTNLVRRLFSKIAPYYDLINDVQSLGLHRRWKARLVSSLKLKPSSILLDLACGSGDVAFRALQQQPQARVWGGDLTLPMLRTAQLRHRASREPRPSWIQLDSLNLPIRSESVDAVSVAYGLRNVHSPERAIQEIYRVLKCGGTLGILDFGKPPSLLIRSIYFFWLKTFQPLLGWLFFQDAETYRYIHESLLKYPAQEGVIKLLHEHGFKQIQCYNLAGGTMSLHFAERL